MFGISYSVVPSVMFPYAARLVAPERFGTAIGLMWVIQNAGIGGANLLAGVLNDAAGAGANNAAGYLPMMLFFLSISALGFVFALLLWRAGPPRVHASRGSTPPPHAPS